MFLFVCLFGFGDCLFGLMVGAYERFLLFMYFSLLFLLLYFVITLSCLLGLRVWVDFRGDLLGCLLRVALLLGWCCVGFWWFLACVVCTC